MSEPSLQMLANIVRAGNIEGAEHEYLADRLDGAASRIAELEATNERLVGALRDTREALVSELVEGERSLKWKNVLERSASALRGQER